MKISVLVGNPRAGSRTLALARAVADRFGEPTVIDLAEYAGELFAWPSPRVDALLAEVAASDLVVVASPTYKASYTGLLKAFLDRYPTRGLATVVAVAVMTGGGHHHAMAPEVHLRPLLVELGASVPASALYFVTADMARMDEAVAVWAAEQAGPVRAALAGRMG